MKQNILWAIAFLIIATASCQKNAIPESPETVLDGPTGQILLSIGQPETKVAVADMAEHRINQVQVFIFNSAGQLETDRMATNASPATSATLQLSLTAKIGKKTIVALVNAPRQKPASLSQLEAAVSDLNENSVNNLVMIGKESVAVEEYNGTPGTCTIPVSKLASAVVLTEVTANFTGTVLEGSSFVIKEVYVKNVVGRVPYGSPSSGTDYRYNKAKLDTTPLALTYDACNLSGTAVAKPNRAFYVYPNTKKGETCLVIHAQVGGKDTYYPFDLPVLEANKKYSVSVNITMLGKPDDNDDTRIAVGTLQPTITVSDWDKTATLPYLM